MKKKDNKELMIEISNGFIAIVILVWRLVVFIIDKLIIFSMWFTEKMLNIMDTIPDKKSKKIKK